jgi:hypothetical protein
MAPGHSKFGLALEKEVEKLFDGASSDPIEFIYKENWLTLSSIGSIFTFALVSNFRASIFDKLMNYILPPESFEYMKVTLPDIGASPPTKSMNPYDPSEMVTAGEPNELDFGGFVRESIIWIFMTLLLYLLATFLRFPDRGGITFNTTPVKPF